MVKKIVRRLWIVLFIMFVLTALVYGQKIDDPQLFIDIGCTEEEVTRIMEIQNETERIIKESGVELNLYKAQLQKLLFPTDVNMREVEKLLRASLEWKLKAELAEIRRRVEIRNILGENRWEKFMRTLRAHKQKSKSFQKQQGSSGQDKKDNAGTKGR